MTTHTPPEQLFTYHAELCDAALTLMKRKNADYTNSANAEEPNCFANFTRCESMGICTAEQGFLVRITDKLSRLSTFTTSGELQVKDESVKDTILDLINYSVLFLAYLDQERKLTNSESLEPLPVKTPDTYTVKEI